MKLIFISYYLTHMVFKSPDEVMDLELTCHEMTKLLESKRFMRTTTSKFLVQSLNAECGGLETFQKDSRQMFQYSNRVFEEILQISFKISFGP